MGGDAGVTRTLLSGGRTASPQERSRHAPMRNLSPAQPARCDLRSRRGPTPRVLVRAARGLTPSQRRAHRRARYRANCRVRQMRYVRAPRGAYVSGPSGRRPPRTLPATSPGFGARRSWRPPGAAQTRAAPLRLGYGSRGRRSGRRRIRRGVRRSGVAGHAVWRRAARSSGS
jgi:hypothetical protein